MLYADRLLGVDYASTLKKRFENALEEEFTTQVCILHEHGTDFVVCSKACGPTSWTPAMSQHSLVALQETLHLPASDWVFDDAS